MASVPDQISRHIRGFVSTGSLGDVEHAILAVQNLLFRSRRFVLEFDQDEDIRFVFRPRVADGVDVMIIELQYDPPDAQTASITLRAYPFQYQTGEQIEEQKRWILFLIYDLLQQFGVDFEYDSNARILAMANANLTRRALTAMFRRLRQSNAPQWYKDFRKVIPIIRGRIASHG